MYLLYIMQLVTVRQGNTSLKKCAKGRTSKLSYGLFVSSSAKKGRKVRQYVTEGWQIFVLFIPLLAL